MLWHGEVQRDVSLAAEDRAGLRLRYAVDQPLLTSNILVLAPTYLSVIADPYFLDLLLKMETAGVALAVLPLLLNQLDNYVQGIETFKLFGARRYRRELEWYRSNLGTQQTIFKNTLLRLMDGVVEYEEGVDDLTNNPLGDLLQRESLRSTLREKLGSGFDPFVQTMNELSSLLNNLYRKLGWEIGMSAVVCATRDRRLTLRLTCPALFQNVRTDKSFLKDELRKFKNIFSKSIYDNMISRIDTANNLLKTLVEQSDHRAVIQKRRISKRQLARQRKARKSARSLHNAIIRGKCWKCPCKDRHAVHFILKYPDLDKNEEPSKQSNDSRFRMVIASPAGINRPHLRDIGLMIETESEMFQSKTNTQNDCPPYCITGQIPIQKRVQFSMQDEEPRSPSVLQTNQPPDILDICGTLSSIGLTGKPTQYFGCFSDESHRHNMYYIRNIAADLKTRSLSELLAASSNYFQAPTSDQFLFTQKHRLRLAVNLACSVLQFHGSWLEAYWRARDIMFNTAADIDSPFVRWDVGNEVDTRSMCKGKGKGKASSPLIQSEILFPLGLVLVELSLCQTLDALRTADDEDRTEAYAEFKTAARYVDLVEQQSGTEYKKVVKTCLFWPGDEEFDLDNEEMQDDMFRLVISPLIQNLRIFEGGM